MSKIREYRKSLGLSQEKFAEELKVQKTTISRIESGKRTASVALVKRICEHSGGKLTADDVIAIPVSPSLSPEAAR